MSFTISIFRVAEDFQVALKFQSFEIENHDNCVYDFLGRVQDYVDGYLHIQKIDWGLRRANLENILADFPLYFRVLGQNRNSTFGPLSEGGSE